MPNRRLSGRIAMPCGGELWLERPRSHGPLSGNELAFCRTEGIPLAFDTLQSGWITDQAEDDLSPTARAVNEVVSRARPRVMHSHPNKSLHVHLRPWAQSDLARYVQLLDDPEVWDNMYEAYPAPLTRDMAADLIDLSNDSPHHLVQAVLFDMLPVGQVRLLFNALKGDPSVGEISYWFGRDHWAQGLATATVGPFARQCLAENPHLGALIARVRDGNTASLRVLQKAGFLADGCDAKPGWQVLRKSR